MPVRSLRRIPVFVWIPPIYSALHKIEITRNEGNITDDITDIIYEGEITDGATDTIGNFSFKVDNSSEAYTGVWTGNEILNVYIDYATSATSLRFRGRIEKVSYQDTNIIIKGRSESSKLLDIAVTKSYSNIETSIILKDLFDAYGTDFTYNNTGTSTTNITVNWYQKPFWECVLELCNAAGFDCYIDSSLDCHYFESGSIDNTTECVVHESNIFEVGDFAYDYSLIKNRVIVYGAKQEEIPVISTSENTTSQTDYGIKELIINDSSITTTTQAQERADYELAISKDPPLVGEVTSLGLATIQPGERIRISAPLSNLSPGYYKILAYKHKINGLLKTILTIEKEPKKIYHLMKDRITKEEKLSERENPNEMKYSWINTFDSDSGSHSDTEISEGRLKLQSGKSTGSWISDKMTISSDATGCELRAKGEALPGTQYFVSTDDGNIWQPVDLNIEKVPSPTGRDLKIKITLNSSSTQLDSIGLLYKI